MAGGRRSREGVSERWPGEKRDGKTHYTWRPGPPAGCPRCPAARKASVQTRLTSAFSSAFCFQQKLTPFSLFFFFVRALGASAEPGNLPQGLLRYVCMALLVGLFNVSNFCGKIGAFISVLRRRICLESKQKAFKVASGFTQL